MRKNQQQLIPWIKTDRSIEITEDELKQVIGGATLPGMHKMPDVTLKRG
jgi:bacteriocin-like protein